MNNIYLNEERYTKNNKKVKLVGTIIMMSGLSLIIFGIVQSINASKIVIPSMMDSNWFNVSSLKHQKDFMAHGCIMLGVFLEMLGIMVRFFVGNSREIMAYQYQTAMPVIQEGIQSMTPQLCDLSKTMIREMKPIYKEMMPIYKEIAKEVSSGIKEGMKE